MFTSPRYLSLIFFQRQQSPEEMVQSIVDDLINLSTEISVRNAAPSRSFLKKTLESWSSKYLWLVVKKDGKEIRLVCETTVTYNFDFRKLSIGFYNLSIEVKNWF